MAAHTVVGIGEVLWDSLPEGLFLGGAPFNVCYHLCELGHESFLVSAVGHDALGEEAEARIRRFGMPTEGLQVNEEHPTGRVPVRLDASGTPTYEILQPVAYDAIELTDTVRGLVDRAEVVVFGSLAQRSAPTRQTIEYACCAPALKCFDLNLRAPFDDAAIVLASLEASDLVKLNAEELRSVAEWAEIARDDERETMSTLAQKYRIATMCVTRGDAGALLLNAGRFHEHSGYRVDVIDTVGAGDAFLAGLLDAYFRGESPDLWLEWANRCGAYVAAAAGATPPMSRERVEQVVAGRCGSS